MSKRPRNASVDHRLSGAAQESRRRCRVGVLGASRVVLLLVSAVSLWMLLHHRALYVNFGDKSDAEALRCFVHWMIQAKQRDDARDRSSEKRAGARRRDVYAFRGRKRCVRPRSAADDVEQA
eukprot:scaffold1272_cov250-Pinguiococcus_pyrenoidosus.AAC.38